MTDVERQLCIRLLEAINTAAEADMLAGNPVSGAHHRAIERKLRELREGQAAGTDWKAFEERQRAALEQHKAEDREATRRYHETHPWVPQRRRA